MNQTNIKAALLLPIMFAAVTYQYALVAVFVLLSWPATALTGWLTKHVGVQTPPTVHIPIPRGWKN